MNLPDDALNHLREVIEEPDLSATKYRLVGPLGQGGMGNVYIAHDTVLNRNIALKILRVQDKSGELVKRMSAEAKTAAKLEHPGIIPVHDLGTLPDGRVYYVTKLVQGQRLDEFAARVESVADCLRMFLKICEAVAYAHSKNVLHRDLKPANIMVGEFGEVLILDWGTARDVQEISSHTAGHGTKGYMSPEQEQGAALDLRADIYALGATLYYILTGADPALGHSHEHMHRLRKPLAAIIHKATNKNKESRYASVSTLADDVLSFLDGNPVVAYRETPLEKIGRQLSRHRFIVVILLTYMVIRLIFYLALRR